MKAKDFISLGVGVLIGVIGFFLFDGNKDSGYKDLVKAKDPLEAKAKHDNIISNYKSLRKLIDCL